MKTTCILALLAGAGIASAGVSSSADLSGLETWDAEGDASNTVLTHVIAGDDILVTAIAWDVIQFAGLDLDGASWLSEMTIGMDFDGDGINDLYITPSATDSPGSEANSSGGFLDLTDNGIPDMLAVGGTVNIELFESFVDDPDLAEGVFEQGSSVSFLVPAPGAGALLCMGGLVATRRRR